MAEKKLFVSYRRSSWSFTYWLAEELAKLVDAHLFVDYSGIDETDFEHSLLRNLRESDAVLLIVTDQTFDAARIHHEKDWVRREIREALTLQKPIALACYNGLFPPADLPEDIQGVRGIQGIEFYPRYFKAGIRELAVFLDKATPVKLQNAIAAPPAASTVVQPAAPATHKALLDEATSLHEAGQYDRAIEIYDRLIAEQYRPRLLSIPELREQAIGERATEQRRWEAGEIYDEIAALFRVNPERGAQEYTRFRADYAEFTEDPAGLASRSTTPKKEVIPPSKPATTGESPPAAITAPQKQVSPAAQVALQCLAVLTGHDKQVNGVAFSPDGTLLAAACGGYWLSSDATVHLWSVAERQKTTLPKGHTHTANNVVFSPDGTLLASCSSDNTIRLWDVATQQEIVALKGHTNWVFGLAFSPDGRLLASCGWDYMVRLWDVAAQQEITVLTGHTWRSDSVAFSPDGRLLASASEDDTIRLWDVAAQREISMLTTHKGDVNCVAFSPDGSLLASGGNDKTIRLWDVAAQREIVALEGHKGSVKGIAFNPDGKILASGSEDRTVRLWKIAARKQAMVLSGHTGKVRTVAFSLDGSLLASGSDDQTVRLWGFQ
jgi:WD40 repeat protein